MADKENRKTVTIDERTIVVPLGIVVTVVTIVAGAAIWGVRTIDQIARDIAIIRAQVSVSWTINHQREWANEIKLRAGTNLPSGLVLDADQIWERINRTK